MNNLVVFESGRFVSAANRKMKIEMRIMEHLRTVLGVCCFYAIYVLIELIEKVW